MTLKFDMIWLSAQNRKGEIFDPKNGSTDVVVQFTDGGRWAASFFTFSNIEQIRLENQHKGDFLGGKYFWTRGMLLIEECSRELIRNVLTHLIEEGDFKQVFIKIN